MVERPVRQQGARPQSTRPGIFFQIGCTGFERPRMHNRVVVQEKQAVPLGCCRTGIAGMTKPVVLNVPQNGYARPAWKLLLWTISIFNQHNLKR